MYIIHTSCTYKYINIYLNIFKHNYQLQDIILQNDTKMYYITLLVQNFPYGHAPDHVH